MKKCLKILIMTNLFDKISLKKNCWNCIVLEGYIVLEKRIKKELQKMYNMFAKNSDGCT